jgi:hypothetical protein
MAPANGRVGVDSQSFGGTRPDGEVAPEPAIGCAEDNREPTRRLLLDRSPATAAPITNYCWPDAISTCISGVGEIQTSPVKGRSWAKISKNDAATPLVKSPIAIAMVLRLSM